jgi:hypothetical protein
VTPAHVIALIPVRGPLVNPRRVSATHVPPAPTRRLSLPLTTGDRQPVNTARAMGRARPTRLEGARP